ncbi:hypothetical protein BFW01_g12503 [Lasiodiplodia theobromae]|nr:hypothetical protein BFW01_g12503 [Lasiodiplodia theobromae]
MNKTDFKGRADSLTNIHNEYPRSKVSDTRPSAQRRSVLRSVPLDSKYSFDLSHEIQRAWSTELTCCPDLHAGQLSSLVPRPPPLSNYRKPLSHHLSTPDSLFQSLTSRPVNPQPGSPLFSKLPPEIREQIYSHLLTYSGVILCVTDGGLPTPRYGLEPGILTTCRRAALEALPLLYGGRNRFSVFHIPNLLRSRGAPPRFALWPRCFALVRRLNVDVPDKFIERWYRAPWSAAADGFESYAAVTGALVALAAGSGRLRHLQLSLVRNCALESYTSWGPYVAEEAPLMQAIAKHFLPGVFGDGFAGADGRSATFLLVVPCGSASAAGGPEAQRAFDVLRPDAPAVVHAVARSLGTLQKTARLNGLKLEDSLKVVVKENDGDGDEVICGESRTEILVDEESQHESEGNRVIALEVSF